MNARTVVGALVAGTIGFAVLGGTPLAGAEPSKAKAAATQEALPPPPPAEPAIAKKPVALPIDGVQWSMSPKALSEVIDKALEEDYRPLYKDVAPGIGQLALDAQLAEDQAQFQRSAIEFGKLPTGVDATPLKGEYTYENNESMMNVTRQGTTTSFFFIQGRLWKMVVEHKLGDDAPYGKTFVDAVAVCANTFGVPGRVLIAGNGQTSNEVDWKDATTHVRAIQRSDTAMAIAYEDNATLGILATLRTAKPVDPNAIDPDVASVIRKPDVPPPIPVKPDPKATKTVAKKAAAPPPPKSD